MSGRRDNEGKPRMSLLPFDALRELASLFTWGASKYGAWNWAKGLSWSETMDSLIRHQEKWLKREELDESGFNHDVHILWNAIVLVAMRLRGIGKDDRYRSDAIADDVPRHPIKGDISDPVVPVTASDNPSTVIPGYDYAHVMWPNDNGSYLLSPSGAIIDPVTCKIIGRITHR